MDALAYFEQLGDTVDQTWTAAGRRADQLAELATTALLDIPVPSDLTASTVLGLLAEGSDLPKQRSSSDQFGQPPAIMYKRPDLEIQALTWMDGTTAIHQHGFDGAFRVAAGSSLHVTYQFDQSDTLADGHVVTGALAAGQPEILWVGDVRPIVSGPEFIHALFHLERPSVTIVVRNSSSGLPFPQYTYRLPGVGVDELYTDDRLLMRLRGLRTLHRIDQNEAVKVARQVVREHDLWTAFRLCDYWAYNFGEGSELEAIIADLSSRGSAVSSLLEPMYAEELRRGRLLARRGMLRQSHHRMFLALIVNLPDRRAIESAVRQLHPDEDPGQLIADWVSELASPEFRGISGLSMGSDQLERLQHNLRQGESDAALGEVAAQWSPPPLLEKLFV